MHILKLMKIAVAGIGVSLATLGAAMADNWIIKDSASDVAATADKLVAAVEGAGAKVFARVDHAAGAASIDAELAPMTLVMFGNPKLGTPILQNAPQAGLDLPIRVLIWDDNGSTKIGYLDPADLKARYEVEGADKSFEMMTGALGKLTDAASQ
ncbi:MAG: DUF302 domain-containing protein [Pseudomonadota bacterium]